MSVNFGERRSLKSRFFRWSTQPKVVRKAPLVMCLGWAVGFAAGTTPTTGDDTSIHLAFAGTLVGGALAFMAMFAGISHWVAEPAAERVLSKHTALGARAHPEFIAREEWDDKHGELMNEVNEIKVMVAELSARSGGMSHKRND